MKSQFIKPFFAGFAIGLLGFAVVNVLAHFYYPYASSDVRAIVQYYGFPFIVWTKSGLTQPFNRVALAADIGLAAVFSATVGLFWKRHVSA